MVRPDGWVWNLVLIKVQPPCPTLLAPREMLPPLLYLSRSESHWAKMTENNRCEICAPRTILRGWLSYRAQRGEAWLVKSCHHLHFFLSLHCWGCSFALGLGGNLKELCMLGWANGSCVFVILLETLWQNCLTCFWMYRKEASLDQQPIIMMRQTEQLPKNMAIAALELIECVPISSFLICSTSLPMAWMASFIAAINYLDVMWLILLNCQMADMGVSSFVPL